MRPGLIAAGAIVLGSVLMGALGWGLQHAAVRSPQLLGRTAPALAIQQQDGSRLATGALHGKPVVINFWASWCGPCEAELPVLSSAAAAHPGVAFMGANMQDTTTGAQAFEQRHHHVYPVGPIVAGSYQAYGVLAPPATIFINADGVVTASFAGPLDAQTLDHYLELIAP